MMLTERTITDYAVMGLEYYVRNFPGRLLQAAQNNESTIMIVEEAAKYALKMLENSPYYGLVRSFLPQLLPTMFSAAVQLIPSVVTEARKRKGELGEVATKYPTWFKEAMLEFLEEVRRQWVSGSGLPVAMGKRSKASLTPTGNR